MSGVNFPTTNASTGNYIEGAGDAGSPRKAGGLPQDPVVPDAPEGKGDVSDRGFMPDAAGANVDMTALSGMMVATLSPGALLAALCVKEAAKQNEQNTTELLKRNESVQKDIMLQAKKIEDAAYDKMALAITGAVVSATASIAAAKITVSGGSGDALTVAKAKGEATSQFGSSLGGIFNAIGGYVESKAQAENKRLDADIEQHRTIMEVLRNSMQAQRDLISKSLEFMNSMQSNINQTMSRIMG